MENNDQLQSQEQEENEYDYNREPPLDQTTISANRRRSKYVFMTLCFLGAAVMLYMYTSHSFSVDNAGWFPLFAAVVLTIMGIVFLRSPDTPPTPQASVLVDKVDQEGEAQEQKSFSPFEELVQEALTGIPEEFREKMESVSVHVAYEPDQETLERAGAKEGYTLLGLYEGVPLTVYGRDYAPYPELITIFQRPIEEYCQYDPERIREQVRTTVLHEVAHHFGMGHEEMPIWVK
jgi:predicted Zn-dependent protease with MMP-like domain